MPTPSASPPRPEPESTTYLAETGVVPLPLSWVDSNSRLSRAGFKYRGYTLIVTTAEDSQLEETLMSAPSDAIFICRSRYS